MNNQRNPLKTNENQTTNQQPINQDRQGCPGTYSMMYPELGVTLATKTKEEIKMAKKKQSKCRDEVWNNTDGSDNIRYEVVISPCEPTKDGEDDKLTVAFWAIAVYMENLITEWHYEKGTFNKCFEWAPFLPKAVIPYVEFDMRKGSKFKKLFVL